jgi:formate hydrogenlyase subunit 6/NADH:ubiquinone oxidoreductase subunit I
MVTHTAKLWVVFITAEAESGACIPCNHCSHVCAGSAFRSSFTDSLEKSEKKKMRS